MNARATARPVIVSIDTPTLGDRSYLAHDRSFAVVIDPQRDIDRVLAVAEREGVDVTHVFETHIHNDYVTGGLALAGATGAAYHVNAADHVSFDRVPISDCEVVPISPAMRVRVIATPGRTGRRMARPHPRAAHPWLRVVLLRRVHRWDHRLHHRPGAQTESRPGQQHQPGRGPEHRPLTLLGDSAEQVAEAQRELVRIGIDHLRGAPTGSPSDWTDGELGSFERAVFHDGHIDGALNIPLHDLPTRLGDVPDDEL